MKNAEESRQIAKARRKLKKRLEIIDRQFTDSALQEVVDRMHTILEQDNVAYRSERKTKHGPFDQNGHSAQVSQSVSRVREQLVRKIEEEMVTAQSLAGRVTKRIQSDLATKARL